MMSTSAAHAGHVAAVLHVRGIVQGVGFRPYVARLAARHDLAGWVRNESGEVRIRVEGDPASVSAFARELPERTPPLARIDTLEETPDRCVGPHRFEIVPSEIRRDRRLPVSPDVAICSDCARELSDPTDRRYRYAFITCTDCGPRYTVIESMPYDRERTSMGVFAQCAACLREYGDPSDRRCHSQTNSCSECGPLVWAVARDGKELGEGESAIRAVAARIIGGEIVAIRGLGGFHLAVDATDEAAVRRLRARKGRDEKPLAVMVRDVEAARRFGDVGPREASLLDSRESPIVLLRESSSSGLAPSVAPGLDTVGVMTAYTPLHHLLLDIVRRPVVMTSGNATDEPIAISNGEARKRLSGVADGFLLHDREIVSRYDDSVVRVTAAGPVFLRRARGYAPLPIELPIGTPAPLVAVGPHLKNTFALAQGRSAYVSQHIGDLENLQTLTHFRDTLGRYRELFRIEPRVAVRDLHPGYLSTRVAEELTLDRTIAIQHHHAHVAAVAAEHGVTAPVLGVAFDGTGYGADGNVWGAELLIADLRTYRRAGQLRYAPFPGGDLAARRPWRAALGYLSLAPDEGSAFESAFDHVSPRRRELAATQIERRINAPLASSMGRLFDAAAAVLGLRTRSSYEGQAAMELEAVAGHQPAEPLPFPIEEAEPGRWVLDPLPLLVALGTWSRRGRDVGHLAARFHESIAEATAALTEKVAESSGIRSVVLSGGCFQNARLLASVARRLENTRLRPLLPRRLSPNDGAISYGQAAVAAALLADQES